MKNTCQRIVMVAMIALSSLTLNGCGQNLDGVYHAASGGPMTITIKGGKALVDIGGESKTFDYKVDGNKLTIINPTEGDLVMTINDDGTLNSQLGLMKRQS